MVKAKTTKKKAIKKEVNKDIEKKVEETNTTEKQTQLECTECGREMKYFGTAKVYTKCTGCRKNA